MGWCVADGASVDEVEVSVVAHHGVAGVKIAVKGAKAEHERSVNSEQLQHVWPGERPRLKVIFQRWVGDFFHHQHVFVGHFSPHGWKVQFWHREVLLDFSGLCQQVLTALNLVEEVQLP